jgi:hypothetical protein
MKNSFPSKGKKSHTLFDIRNTILKNKKKFVVNKLVIELRIIIKTLSQNWRLATKQ